MTQDIVEKYIKIKKWKKSKDRTQLKNMKTIYFFFTQHLLIVLGSTDYFFRKIFKEHICWNSAHHTSKKVVEIW